MLLDKLKSFNERLSLTNQKRREEFYKKHNPNNPTPTTEEVNEFWDNFSNKMKEVNTRLKGR